MYHRTLTITVNLEPFGGCFSSTLTRTAANFIWSELAPAYLTFVRIEWGGKRQELYKALREIGHIFKNLAYAVLECIVLETICLIVCSKELLKI